MNDPRFDPLPEDVSELPERFVRDLAWGVMHQKWENGFYIQGIPRAGWGGLKFTKRNSDDLKKYLSDVWGNDLPDLILIVDSGYIVASETVGDNTSVYKLTRLGLQLGKQTMQPNSIPNNSELARDQSVDKKAVWVVHGRDSKLRDAMFDFLRSINLYPMEWNQIDVGKGSPYNGEILDKAFSQAQAVVVILSSEDIARLQRQFQQKNDLPFETRFTGQARPNVIFEAGMAFGRYSDRTVLVEIGSIRPFSDVAGIQVVRMDNTAAQRQLLAQRLKSAGCDINTNGRDWFTKGDFSTDHLEDMGKELTSEDFPNKNANVWWLCRDLYATIGHILDPSTTKQDIDYHFGQSLHHAKVLELNPSIIQRISLLMNEAAHWSKKDWTFERQQNYRNAITSIMNDIGTELQRKQPNFDPGASRS